MSTPVIECRNLKKYFDTPFGKLHAVDNVSFTLDAHKKARPKACFCIGFAYSKTFSYLFFQTSTPCLE